MTPRKLNYVGDPTVDVPNIVQALNYGEVILPFPMADDAAIGVSAVAGGGNLLGGWSIDRNVFRSLLGADATWMLYAAGGCNPNDANTLTMELSYVSTNGATVTVLGSTTQAGAGYTTKSFGPVDLFGTVSAAKSDTVLQLRLTGRKNAGVNGLMRNWTVWLRIVPEKR